MDRIKQMLVIVDPTGRSHPCIDKAGELAAAFGGKVELFICDATPTLKASYLDELEKPEEFRNRLRQAHIDHLQSLAGPLRRRGIEVTVDVSLEKPLHRSIIVKVQRLQPDLVIKDTHYHPVIGRSIITNTDWHLIRESPAPLMLVKPAPWPAGAATLLAAVDPGHLGDKPAALDHDIVTTAAYLQTGLRGKLLVIHAFDIATQMSVAMGVGDGAVGGVVATALLEDLRRDKKRALDALAAGHKVAPELVHLLDGSPAEVLPDFAATKSVDIVVMGAIARGALFNFFVGSTAEHVLDRLPCDMLIIKPEALARHLQSLATAA